MTEPTTDKIELLKMALLEAGQPPNLVARVCKTRIDDWDVPVVDVPAGIDGLALLRATHLVRLQVDGPRERIICPRHDIGDRPDIWATCGRVTVADALLGRTCGAP